MSLYIGIELQNMIASIASSVEGLQTAIMGIRSSVILTDMESINMSDLTATIQVEVEAVVTEQPEIDMPDMETEDTAAEIQEITTSIEQMHQAISTISENPFQMDSQAVELQMISLIIRLRETFQEQQQLQEALSHMDIENEQPPPVETPPEPIEVPIVWQTDGLEVFTDTGIDRFRLEIESANSMLEQLHNTQDRIATQAYNTNLFPPAAFQDLNEMAVRIDMLRNRMQQIVSNPMNIMGANQANTEIEQLRARLDQAVQQQNELNTAMQNMDVSAANTAYLRLSQTVAGTEQYIRDNVDEQGQFNNIIQESADSAFGLKNIISKIVEFVSEGMESFDSQLKTETQLMSVLANTLDDKQVTEYMIETDVTVDTSEAVNEINAISDINDVVITADARTEALQAKFDAITDKADEISSKGIYGGDVMIAGATELSTYFKDTDAIEMMMDTLSDYAMGMSGGGELDSSAMAGYATGLGTLMSGDYDAMEKKGFKFTEPQKAIIEGNATDEQIVAALGEEYIGMSQDMQAAAAIAQVVERSWAGLYETMSGTPEGKIIQMTSAWDDMKQMVAEQLYPYIILVVDAISNNWDIVETVMNGFVEVLKNVLAVIDWIAEGVVSVASFIVDNWSVISPIIYGIIAALAVYGAYLAINKGIELASAAAEKVMAAATFIASVAQNGLNAALAACPVVWIIIAIIALIAVIITLCNWIANVTGAAQSGIGIIMGAVAVAAAFVGNLVVTLINLIIDIIVVLWNFIAAFVNFFGNVFTDPINAIGHLVFDLVDDILGLLQTVASAIDTIFGSNLAGSVQGWRDSLGDWVDDTFGKRKEIMVKVSGTDWHVDRFEYEEAWKAGAKFGDGISEAISGFNLTNMLGLDDKLDDSEDYEVSAEDYKELAEQYTVSAEDYGQSLDSLDSNLDDIADDTGDISDSLEISEENLKYLRDLAEQEAVNRFTTAEITIEQNNTNNISSKMDLDGVISGMTDAVNEAISIATEGVH